MLVGEIANVVLYLPCLLGHFPVGELVSHFVLSLVLPQFLGCLLPHLANIVYLSILLINIGPQPISKVFQLLVLCCKFGVELLLETINLLVLCCKFGMELLLETINLLVFCRKICLILNLKIIQLSLSLPQVELRTLQVL